MAERIEEWRRSVPRGVRMRQYGDEALMGSVCIIGDIERSRLLGRVDQRGGMHTDFIAMRPLRHRHHVLGKCKRIKRWNHTHVPPP